MLGKLIGNQLMLKHPSLPSTTERPVPQMA